MCVRFLRYTLHPHTETRDRAAEHGGGRTRPQCRSPSGQGGKPRRLSSH
jgi:hypothetical protein